MNEELRALGLRAVAKRDFMRVAWRGAKVHPILKDGTVDLEAEGLVVSAGPAQPPVVFWLDIHKTRAHHPKDHLLPDLSDPATVGCLLALVENGELTWSGLITLSFLEALVVALEAAP